MIYNPHYNIYLDLHVGIVGYYTVIVNFTINKSVKTSRTFIHKPNNTRALVNKTAK